MSLLNSSLPESSRSQFFPVFRAPEDDFDDEGRRVAVLVDDWLKSQEEYSPDSPAARLVERRLHDAIKSGPFFGKILSFAGLNLWVDDRTSKGRVELQESISL